MPSLDSRVVREAAPSPVSMQGDCPWPGWPALLTKEAGAARSIRNKPSFQFARAAVATQDQIPTDCAAPYFFNVRRLQHTHAAIAGVLQKKTVKMPAIDQQWQAFQVFTISLGFPADAYLSRPWICRSFNRRPSADTRQKRKDPRSQ
jgi:hypothetical protein